MKTAHKILITDFHGGLLLAQGAVLKEAGVEVHRWNLGDTQIEAVHSMNVKDLSATELKTIRNIRYLFYRVKFFVRLCFQLRRVSNKLNQVLGILPSFSFGLGWFGLKWTPKKTTQLFRLMTPEVMRATYAHYDSYLVSFPPSMAHLLLALAEKYDRRLILNLGHRFGIGLTTRKDHESILSLLNYIHQHPHHILAAGSEYDCKYVSYYLGYEPKKLSISCHHLKLEVPEPDQETILIASLGRRERELNERAQQWGRQHGCKPRQFVDIRSLYPHYAYADLVRHPAVIVFPYSAYSVLSLELYELNIPCFISSPRLVIDKGLMHDRVLFPVYASEKQYRRMALPAQRNIPSPNSYEAEAQEYWLQYCFYYQVQNAMVWDSEEELMHQLATVDLAKMRKNMYAENRVRRRAALCEWKSIL